MKRYWKSLPERDRAPDFLRGSEQEFSDTVRGPDLRTDRRGFLRAAGFSLAGVAAGCARAPVEQAIPFLVQPEGLTPGRPSFYASTCRGCSAGCGVLVKTRDGRPIKLEGNPEHPISRGGLCAVGQASILGLYDSQRLTQPVAGGEATSWQQVDQAVRGGLDDVRRRGGAVRFLTGTVNGPTERGAITGFLDGFSDARHVAYDALSSSAVLDAHERTHGVRLLPRYRFERARVVIGVDADFLGTWISPVEFTAGYRAGRTLDARPPMLSYHVQVESVMSLTGAQADERLRLAPEAVGAVLAHLTQQISAKAGVPRQSGTLPAIPVETEVLQAVADRLWEARGRSLIVCGRQDLASQVLVNLLNHLLDNYGSTVVVEEPSHQRLGSDREVAALLDEVGRGAVDALFIAGVNPVYDLPGGEAFGAAFERIPLVVSFASHLDETASLAHYVCPDHHVLEAWGDQEAVSGLVSVVQPVVHPLGDTRAMLESLSAWRGAPRPAYEMLRESWREAVFPRRPGALPAPAAGPAGPVLSEIQPTVPDGTTESGETPGPLGTTDREFQAFWDRAVHDGFAEVEGGGPAVTDVALDAAPAPPTAGASSEDDLQLVLYPKVGLLDGRHAHNAWLQELPDPVSKVTWDNYACLSVATAARLGIDEGDLVRLETADGSTAALELPAYIQPGQDDAVVAVALGYGRKGTERFATIGPRWFEARSSVDESGRVGKNVAPLLAFENGLLAYSSRRVRLTRTGVRRPLAVTQEHHSIMVPHGLAPPEASRRPIVQETTLPAYLEDPGAGSQDVHEAGEDLWPVDHHYPNHRWAMVVDLSACTGCSACVIGCQVENNIPVVGRDEVERQREMHWLRIDRYYSDHDDDVDVVHQPMLCQHCEHAPCETVCPVLATVHSEEGLNQQIYNRCVGTRYCANNCPYKVRRFNWFDYPREDRLQNLVLNPDVVVRSRGVMEKCSFCVQRIENAKIESRRLGRPVADGDVQTACQQSCPAKAIVFGDIHDETSRVARLARDPRHFHVLSELNVRPSVGYLTLVRNRNAGEGERHRG